MKLLSALSEPPRRPVAAAAEVLIPRGLGHQVRGREPVRGEGAAREGGAPVAGPLLPAARRARRRRGRREGRADPPVLDQRHALLRVIQVHQQQLTRSCCRWNTTAPPAQLLNSWEAPSTGVTAYRRTYVELYF